MIMSPRIITETLTLPHSLLSNYEMREAGVIVDDVSKNHFRDTDMNKGTQSIHFLNDDKKIKFTVNLVVRAALMTFECSKPTLEEYYKLPVVDIGCENWNPQRHRDDNNALMTTQLPNDTVPETPNTSSDVPENLDSTHFHQEHEAKRRKVCDMVMQAALTFGEEETGDPFYDTEEDEFFDTIDVGIVNRSTPEPNNSPDDNVANAEFIGSGETHKMVTNSGAEPLVLERSGKAGKEKNNTPFQRSKRLMKATPAQVFMMMVLASSLR